MGPDRPHRRSAPESVNGQWHADRQRGEFGNERNRVIRILNVGSPDVVNGKVGAAHEAIVHGQFRRRSLDCLGRSGHYGRFRSNANLVVYTGGSGTW